MITFAINANTHLSKWLLRKSCYQIANLIPQSLSQSKKRKVNLLPFYPDLRAEKGESD